ncbi:hypothetical protein BFL38_11605 [Brachyspira hampsonii]|uniref:Multidrug transporter n=1 Tax=Brachyspira hampsonii TaxID=1287055 RepID=A0A1E5NIS5_9SPIR|nr:hypothetical protein [Brachyspira hampsonii]OEJ16089.1 hypothetical protein BFL38_11605 [Brachyspira hampsonii]
MIKKLFYFKNFNYKLYFSLIFLSLFPALYETIRTIIVSISADSSSFDIMGHLEWFDLINETLLAFLHIPLYAIFNRVIKNHSEEDFAKVTFKTFLIGFILYCLFSIVIYIKSKSMIVFMNVNEPDIEAVTKYLNLETIAFVIGFIITSINIVIVSRELYKVFIIFAFVKTLLIILLDINLVLKFNVFGVAYSNMIINLLMGILGIFILIKNGLIKLSWFNREDKMIFISYFKIGIFSALQILVDNIVYALMIVKMVNLVAEQGNYWIANNFIWSWLLMPVLALNEVIRTNCKYKDNNQLWNYFRIIFFITILASAAVLFSNIFFEHVERIENHNDVYLIVLKLAPFYIFYALSIIPDNIFIGYGKTLYNLINSIIINFVYYGIVYFLYLKGYIVFNMNTIIIMFGLGMIFHALISYIIFIIKFRHNIFFSNMN